jgi:hypothetical protein
MGHRKSWTNLRDAVTFTRKKRYRCGIYCNAFSNSYRFLRVTLEQGSSNFTCSRATFYWQKDLRPAFTFYKLANVCILLQDMSTDISLHKHTQDRFLFYFTLFIYGLRFIYYYLLIPPHSAKIPHYSFAVFTTTLTEIS